MGLISRKLLQIKPQELGKIKIGGISREIPRKDGNGREYVLRVPMKLDHFVVTTRSRNPEKKNNFERDAAIHARIGPTPKELDAVLMYPEVEDNFHAEMCQYAGRGKDGKIWSCDGETARNLTAKTVGPCVRLEGKECKCKPYGRLHVQLLASPYTLGFHVFRTTSWESTNNIQTALEQIFQTFGTCYHAPVKLVIYPSEDKHDQGTSISHKVGLVLAMPMVDVAHQINEARQYARLAGSEVRQLAAGVRQDLDKMDEAEAVEIRDEFFSDVSEADVHAHDTAAALHAPDPDYTNPLLEVTDAISEQGRASRSEADPFDNADPTDPVVDASGRAWSEIAEEAGLPEPTPEFTVPAAPETIEEALEDMGVDTSTDPLTLREDLEGAEARPSIHELERSLKAGDKVRSEPSFPDLWAKYDEALRKASIDGPEDRTPFEARLAREAKVSSPDVTVWTRQDFRSAIAELHSAPAVGDTGADDDLFQG